MSTDLRFSDQVNHSKEKTTARMKEYQKVFEEMYKNPVEIRKEVGMSQSEFA